MGHGGASHLEGAGFGWFQVGEGTIPATNSKLAPEKLMVERVVNSLFCG